VSGPVRPVPAEGTPQHSLLNAISCHEPENKGLAGVVGAGLGGWLLHPLYVRNLEAVMERRGWDQFLNRAIDTASPGREAEMPAYFQELFASTFWLGAIFVMLLWGALEIYYAKRRRAVAQQGPKRANGAVLRLLLHGKQKPPDVLERLNIYHYKFVELSSNARCSDGTVRVAYGIVLSITFDDPIEPQSVQVTSDSFALPGYTAEVLTGRSTLIRFEDWLPSCVLNIRVTGRDTRQAGAPPMIKEGPV
jgi:hypothetical protein